MEPINGTNMIKYQKPLCPVSCNLRIVTANIKKKFTIPQRKLQIGKETNNPSIPLIVYPIKENNKRATMLTR